MVKIWSYSDEDPSGRSKDYLLLMTTADGTILTREFSNTVISPDSHVRLLALDPDGNVM